MPPTDLSSGRTPSKLLNSIKQLLAALLVDRQYFWHLTFLLFLCETTLGLLIIYNIPCQLVHHQLEVEADELHPCRYQD